MSKSFENGFGGEVVPTLLLWQVTKKILFPIAFFDPINGMVLNSSFISPVTLAAVFFPMVCLLYFGISLSPFFCIFGMIYFNLLFAHTLNST